MTTHMKEAEVDVLRACSMLFAANGTSCIIVLNCIIVLKVFNIFGFSGV